MPVSTPPSRGVPAQALVMPTPKGREFAAAVMSGMYKYLAIGGAIGGVKSFTTISTLIVLARAFPGSRWAIVRKDLPTIKRNTIPTIEKMRPSSFMAELNRSDWTYRCINGSELLLFPESIQEDPDLNRWKGLEVNGFLLEEANELQERSFHKAIERAGRWVIPQAPDRPNPKQPPPYVFLTFNPAQGWVQTTFYEPHRAGTLAPPYYFLPTTIRDNPFLPADYLASLENLPPNEYKRFVLGDWSVTTDPDQLIDSAWIIAAYDTEHQPGIGALGVDVARYGDDLTVFARLDGNLLVETVEHNQFSIDRTATAAQNVAATWGISAGQVRVDVVGLGAGVADNMAKAGWKVYEVVSGAQPIERRTTDGKPDSFFRFKNLRSQMWWEFREKLRTGRLALRRPLPRKLFEDLIAPRYEMSGDKVIEVESKDDIKKRLGRSTDHGDAVVYAAFDIPRRRSRSNPYASQSYVTV